MNLFPELQMEPFKTWYSENKVVHEYGEEICSDIIWHILSRIAQTVGGMSYFFPADQVEYHLKGWVTVLQFMTTRQLFNTLGVILEGKAMISGRACMAPRLPLEFKMISSQGIHNSVSPSIQETKLMLQDRSSGAKDFSVGEHYLNEIRKSFRKLSPKSVRK